MKMYRSRMVLISTELKPSVLADNPLDLHNSSIENRFHRQETGLTHPFSRMSGGSKNLEAARRVSFLFPICLGRSKETLLAG